jgi:hypothetical protein
MKGLFVVFVVVPVFQLLRFLRPPDSIPSLQPHCEVFTATMGRSVPDLGFGTLASRCAPLCFTLGIQDLVPAVPRRSLCPTPAPIRRSTSAQSSGLRRTDPRSVTASGFDDTYGYRRGFRSAFGHPPAPVHPGTFDPMFTTTAF